MGVACVFPRVPLSEVKGEAIAATHVDIDPSGPDSDEVQEILWHVSSAQPLPQADGPVLAPRLKRRVDQFGTAWTGQLKPLLRWQNHESMGFGGSAGLLFPGQGFISITSLKRYLGS